MKEILKTDKHWKKKKGEKNYNYYEQQSKTRK